MCLIAVTPEDSMTGPLVITTLLRSANAELLPSELTDTDMTLAFDSSRSTIATLRPITWPDCIRFKIPMHKCP